MARQVLFRILLATALSTGVGVTATSAESFFKNKSAKPTAAATVKKKRGLFWFLFERKRTDKIDAIYGDQGGQTYGDLDPEPLPTIGMGNLTYEPPLQVPLYDIKLLKTEVDTPQAEAVRAVLVDKRSRILASVPNRKAILSFYTERRFTPVWVRDGKLSDAAFDLLATMAHAGEDGLDPAAYLPIGLSSYQSATSDVADLDTNTLMRLDVSLTAQALKFAQHMSSGQFVPELLSQYNDINVERGDPDFTLKVLAYTPYPGAFIATLRPTHPVYKNLKQALAQLDAGATEEPARFPSGPIVKMGQRDDRIPELRQRLMDLGLLDAENAIVAEENRTLLDKPLAAAIKAFQAQNKLKQTGLLDANVVKNLNADPAIDQRNKLLVNMERMRWLPKSLGQRYVFVNQAGYSAEVFEGQNRIWKTKVIVGKPMTQTPAFHDEFETVVFNPSWGMPQSILINEYLGKLRRDPGYFDRIGYKVVNRNGDVVSSHEIDWFSVGPSSGIGVQQPPGSDNALGELKFLFPNKHDVYMHDTPTRKLFGEQVRTFSHGCVRVENPRQFAHVLLGWEAEKIATQIESGASSSVRIPRKTQVHITYFTAWPDDDGKMQYFPDIYERDKTMLEAMDTGARARRELSNQGLADAAQVSGSIGNP